MQPTCSSSYIQCWTDTTWREDRSTGLYEKRLADLVIRTKAEPGRISKQEKENSSRNHFQAFFWVFVQAGYMQIIVILACLAAYADDGPSLSVFAGRARPRLAKSEAAAALLSLSLSLCIFLPHSRYNSGNVISVPRRDEGD